MIQTKVLPPITTPPPRLPLTEQEKLAEAREVYGDDGAETLRELPGLFELEIMHGVSFPHSSLKDAYESGCAEPWTTQLVTSLLIASNQRNVLEIGGFTGQTSAWLALALERLGGGTLTVVEIEAERCQLVAQRLNGLGLARTKVVIAHADSLRYIPTLPDKSLGFVWQDGNHTKLHVESEINALWPKVKPKGIICGHDVWGVCDLQTIYRKYGGIALDFPRLGAAGGIGIIALPS
jgi:predicted O-methyltransferase YrrM